MNAANDNQSPPYRMNDDGEFDYDYYDDPDEWGYGEWEDEFVDFDDVDEAA